MFLIDSRWKKIGPLYPVLVENCQVTSTVNLHFTWMLMGTAQCKKRANPSGCNAVFYFSTVTT